MSKALVRARGVATPDQFKTDWSQFMKQNIDMNMMVYPHLPAMDKSDNQLSMTFAIPKAMVDAANEADPVYIAVCFKDDTNTWQCSVLEMDMSMFATPLDLGGNNYLAEASVHEITIVGSKVTALNVYDVHIVYSNKEINLEVAESVNDLPYVLYGPASEYIIEVTCAA